MREDRAGELEDRIVELEDRVSELESEIRRVRATGMVPPYTPQPPPPTGPPFRPAAPAAPAGPAGVRTDSAWAIELTTEVVLKWAGLFLLFLAAAFLVSTAISRGWIGPELQLLGAVTLGAVLVGAGLRPELRRRRWGKPLVAVGVAVWFTSCGAPSQWLDLGGIGRGLLGAYVVTVIAIGLSRFLDSRLVAFTAFFGLVTVALWVDAFDEYGAVAVMWATLILAVVFHVLHVERGWPGLYLAVVLTTMLIGFAAAFEEESQAAVQVVLGLLAAVHWVTPIAFALIRPDPDDEVAQLGGRLQLGLPTWLWVATVILQDFDADHAPMLVAAVIAAAGAAIGIAGRPWVPQWLWTSQLLGSSIVLSVGLISWLDGSTLLAALALQALAMLVLSTVIGDTWFTWQSIITAGIVWVMALALTLEALGDDAAWGADVVHGLVFGVTMGMGWYLREKLEGRLLALIGYAAGLLWIASVCVHLAQGQLITSALWAAIGLAVVVTGLTRRRVAVARVGLATLALVVAKLLTVDLAEIEVFWRAGLFFVIGLGFLWLSYAMPALVGGDGGDGDRDGGPTAPRSPGLIPPPVPPPSGPPPASPGEEQPQSGH